MGGVRTIDEIRHTNLLLLLAELAAKHGEHGAVQRLAAAMGRSHSQLSQLKTRAPHSKTGKPRNIGSATARLMESAAGKPHGWMDTEHADDTSMQAMLERLIAAELDKRVPEPPGSNVAMIQVPAGSASVMQKTRQQKEALAAAQGKGRLKK
jgi:hypothetical protein